MCTTKNYLQLAALLLSLSLLYVSKAKGEPHQAVAGNLTVLALLHGVHSTHKDGAI